MSVKCEFCGNIFSSKYVLAKHKSTAKFCLKIQGDKDKYSESEKYEQKIRELTQSHKEEILELTEKYEARISVLQDKLENIALKSSLKPTVSHNTFVNNMTPITDDHIRQNAGNLTIDHVKNGAIGYAQYALDYPLKENVVCVDYARRKVKYKDKDGNLVTDPEMLRLLPNLLTLLSPKSTELIDLARGQIKNESKTMSYEENLKLAIMKTLVNDASNGCCNEFHNEMVKYICGKTSKTDG